MSTHHASVALVQAKIEQNRRIKNEERQKQDEEQQNKYDANVEFWKPLVDELQKVANAYPQHLAVQAPPLTLTRGYTFTIGDDNFKLEHTTNGRVSFYSPRASRVYRADSKEELLPMLLEFIADKLS